MSAPEASEGQPADDASALLLELGGALHGAALPADVVEPLLREAARGLQIAVQVFTLQSLVAIEVGTGAAGRAHLRVIAFDTHWNLRRMGALVTLARAVAQRSVGIAEARAAIAEITRSPNRYPRWLVVAAYGVYGAAVAARVGGAGWEMLVAGVVGLVAGGIHFGTLRSTRVDLLKSFLAALAGTLVAFACARLLPPFGLGIAVFGGITLLVPAMVLTIGLHELANEALESGTVRLAYGSLRFLMLGFGIGAALTLARLVPPLPPATTPTPIHPHLAVMGIVLVGGLALTICLQGRRRDVFWIVLGTVLAYGGQELTKIPLGASGSPFAAAFLLGSVAYLYARTPGGFAPVVMVPGLLQLAPGFLGSKAVFALLRGESVPGQSFFVVLLTSLQLCTGLLLAGMIFRRAPARTG